MVSFKSGLMRSKTGFVETQVADLGNGWRIFAPHPETYYPDDWCVCDPTGSVRLKLKADQMIDFVDVFRAMKMREAA